MQYSIVNLSQIVSDFRIDAECYKKEYLEIEKTLKKRQYTTIGRIVKTFSKGIFDIKAECYSDDGVPFVRISDLKNMLIDDSNIVHISEEESEKAKKSILSYGDIVLSKTAYPAASLVSLERCNTSQDTIAVKLREDSNIKSHFLVMFLNSKYGFLQMKRWFTGNIQMHLNLKDSKGIIIPILSDSFQDLIEEQFERAISQIEKSKQRYKQAQTLLLSELGLLNWKPKHHLTFVKSFSDTQQAGRIDAEYFQPKYDEIVKAIKSYSRGWDTLGNLVSVKKCMEVGSDEYLDDGIPFIRVSNLSPFEITEEKYISEELYLKLSEHQPQKGEILLSKDATPGIAYYINEKPRKMIPSGGILRLKKIDDRINEEYLTTVLNSLIVQEQIKRDVGGSVILHWRPDQVKNTLIPILDGSLQDEIKQKINESFNLRKQSKHLLESAKRAVEIAIEEDEGTAIEWLNKEVEGVDA